MFITPNLCLVRSKKHGWQVVEADVPQRPETLLWIIGLLSAVGAFSGVLQ